MGDRIPAFSPPPEVSADDIDGYRVTALTREEVSRLIQKDSWIRKLQTKIVEVDRTEPMTEYELYQLLKKATTAYAVWLEAKNHREWLLEARVAYRDQVRERVHQLQETEIARRLRRGRMRLGPFSGAGLGEQLPVKR